MGSLIQLGNHAQYRNGATFGDTRPILNQLSVSSAAAFSLRLLNSNYTSNCIRVRRSSNSNEMNIGFVNGVLNVAELLDFVGSGSGFVSTWYDQSGNGRNAVQTNVANQPRIVNNGVLDTSNGLPTIRMIASNSNLRTPVIPRTVQNGTYSVVTPEASSRMRLITMCEQDLFEWQRFPGDSQSYPFLGRSLRSSGNCNVPTSGGLVYTQINNGLNHLIYNNGVLGGTVAFSGTADTGSRNLVIGATIDGNVNQPISEAILFLTDLSEQDRGILVRNQGNRYGILVS